MHCPRCGAPNDDTRAACWNCFAQVRLSADVKAEKKADAKVKAPKPPKPEKARKGKKGEAVVDTIPEPVVAPEPAPIVPVAAVVDTAPIELDAIPTEVVASTIAPDEPAPLDFPPIAASTETEAPDFSAAPTFGDFSAEPAPSTEDDTFIAGIPMGQDTETEPEPAAVDFDQDSTFVAGIPMGDEEDDAVPNDARIMDLDAPVTSSSYVIPGLADESPDKPLDEDVEEPDTFGPMAFDLDSEEPGKKPEGPTQA